MNDRNIRQVAFRIDANGRGREGEGRRIWSKYFMHLYEKKTIKTI
jgi:hypothetical protein